jgi:hypothetical protein
MITVLSSFEEASLRIVLSLSSKSEFASMTHKIMSAFSIELLLLSCPSFSIMSELWRLIPAVSIIVKGIPL